MKTIVDIVNQVSENQIDKFSKDKKYNELREYYIEMKSKGLISQKTYTIPPLDTVGKRLYHSKYCDEESHDFLLLRKTLLLIYLIIRIIFY